MQYDKPEDLDWLAFCYIAGELPAAEADAFETRMADDQETREAVARAVGLAFMLAVAEPKAQQHSRTVFQAASTWRHARTARRVAWAAVAAAACLAGVWAYRFFQGPADQPGPPEQFAREEEATISDSPPQQLALLWSRTREELAILLNDYWVSGSADNGESFEVSWSSTEDEADPDLLTADDTLAVNDPPTWMLAAVRAGFGDTATGGYGPSNPQEN